MTLWLAMAGCLSVQPEVAATATPVNAPVTSGGCASSCGLDAAPAPPMTRDQVEALLATWADEPVGEPTLALETLLFHGPETLAWLHTLGTDSLDHAHVAFLETELARDSVTVEMRVVDDLGRERGTLFASSVGLAEKQHLTFQGTGSLGHLETGGKVKRVGLGHLWSRW
jgi:hypothetical protein